MVATSYSSTLISVFSGFFSVSPLVSVVGVLPALSTVNCRLFFHFVLLGLGGSASAAAAPPTTPRPRRQFPGISRDVVLDGSVLAAGVLPDSTGC